jgi:hypothetical protein
MRTHAFYPEGASCRGVRLFLTLASCLEVACLLALAHPPPTTCPCTCNQHNYYKPNAITPTATTTPTSWLIVGPWTFPPTYPTLFDTSSSNHSTPAQCGSHTTPVPPLRRRRHACSRPSTSDPTSTAPQSTSLNLMRASSSSPISC